MNRLLTIAVTFLLFVEVRADVTGDSAAAFNATVAADVGFSDVVKQLEIEPIRLERPGAVLRMIQDSGWVAYTLTVEIPAEIENSGSAELTYPSGKQRTKKCYKVALTSTESAKIRTALSRCRLFDKPMTVEPNRALDTDWFFVENLSEDRYRWFFRVGSVSATADPSDLSLVLLEVFTRICREVK